MQVLLDDAQIQRIARRQHMTVAEGVRQALRAARRREPGGDATRKLEAVRVAVRHSFPTAGIDEMLADIERATRARSACDAVHVAVMEREGIERVRRHWVRWLPQAAVGVDGDLAVAIERLVGPGSEKGL